MTDGRLQPVEHLVPLAGAVAAAGAVRAGGCAGHRRNIERGGGSLQVESRNFLDFPRGVIELSAPNASILQDPSVSPGQTVTAGSALYLGLRNRGNE